MRRRRFAMTESKVGSGRSQPVVRARHRDHATARPQQDDAAGIRNDASSRDPPYHVARLPHERDETPPPRESDAPRERIELGEDDIAQGRENTDLYGKVGEDFDRRTQRRRRR